ncbi:hypothetical protein KR51_00009260 [Rubidibacter lacunae KORDI 51-2]|uniref:Uncharacterized protein n=1 Tax=Rubidibacter lacunae KORDI 51-2 TaxID=582515 RepID=U5DD05_9CHRO|nr:hypothetical protein [Rubidibacter lacunae]ERN42403.1 hypothetical protein KR51_00009260 [Rubidibacter lacunae KORDI 51-2]
MTASIPTQDAAQATEGQDIVVKVILRGGYKETLALKSDTPLLRSLLGAVLERAQNTGRRSLFQIPVEAGRASLCFSSDDLVGVITEPPVYVRPNEQAPEAPEAAPMS